jgi:hypothetical protein
MCRHVVTHRVTDPEGLKTFVGANDEWAFVRVERDAKGSSGSSRFVFERTAGNKKTSSSTKETKTTPAPARRKKSDDDTQSPRTTTKRAKKK